MPASPTLLAGSWRAAADGRWLDVLNPADQREVVGRVPALSAAEIAEAYDAAETAARVWRSTGALERGAILSKAAQILRERRDAIATDLVREMGKTLAEATGEVAKTADFFEYYGALARTPQEYGLADARPDTTVSVRREPVGIVVAITPWNDPLLTPARKLAPALAAGNAVLLKPATETPLVSLHLARALVDAGLPPGTLSVITGRGQDVSAALLGDRRLAAVTFTGSNDVGRTIAATLRPGVRLQTELGGKNATVVLGDADLDLALATVCAAAFGQAGQRCTATSRLILDRPIAAEFIDRLRTAVAALRLGPGLDPATTMGPVVSRGQQKTVLDHIGAAVAAGARLVHGGNAPTAEPLAHGCYVEPTLLADVTPAMAIWRDEVFGPVLAIVEVDGFDAACAALNDSAFGLSASLFTRSLAAAHRFLDRADTGQVAVNLPTSGWDVHHPFGGFRESGSAFKEQGVEGLAFYTRVKTCALRFA